MDSLASLLAAGVFVLMAGVLLILASDLDRRDPPDWSLYAAALIICCWVPVWYLYTSYSWSYNGCSFGMRCWQLRIVDRHGQPPGVARAAARAGALALMSAPLILSPALAASAVSFGTTGPPYMVPLGLVLTSASAAACLSPFLARDGRSWCDRLTGTYIVQSSRPLAAA